MPQAISKYAKLVGEDVWRKLSENQKAAIVASEWRKKNPGRHKELKKNWYRNNSSRLKLQVKDNYYKRTYLISLKEANEILDKQGNACAICLKPICGRNVHIDHNHDTGKLREILCPGCNLGIGFLEKDDGAWVIKAKQYLIKHNPAEFNS